MDSSNGSNVSASGSASGSASTALTLPMKHKWVLWLHYPNDQHWGMDGKDHYERVMELTDMTQLMTLNKDTPDELLQQCMVFLMKDGIEPIWEDPMNRNGGRFSFKIPNTLLPNVWRKVVMCVLGETISANKEFASKITGVTVSPKRAFCILKIWMTDCTYLDTSPIVDIKGLDKEGCIFKKNME